jgi:hypothetical protein
MSDGQEDPARQTPNTNAENRSAQGSFSLRTTRSNPKHIGNTLGQGHPVACTQHASEHIATVTGGPVPKDRPHPVRRATAARPETHQNLIYISKDHAHRRALQRYRHAGSQNNHSAERSSQTSIATPNLLLLRDTTKAPARVVQYNHLNTSSPGQPNRATRRCGGGDRTRTDDPLLAKQVLSQLSYTPSVIRAQQPAIRSKVFPPCRSPIRLPKPGPGNCT